MKLRTKNAIACGAVLLLLMLAGWQNRSAGQAPHKMEPTIWKEQPDSWEMTADTEPGILDEYAKATEAAAIDVQRIYREYPEHDIVIDAVCPTVIEGTEIPCLTAHFTGNFHRMLQDFLSQYPQAEETDKNTWFALGADSEVLAYLTMTESGYISLMHKELDVNGSMGDTHDYNSYDPIDVAALRNICALPDDQLSSEDRAIKNAIQAASRYTDLDIIPYNIVRETDSITGRSWYRIKFQLSYQGIPISQINQDGEYAVDVGMADVGLGALSGRFDFSEMKETGSCHIMRLENILTAFEQQGYLSLLNTYNFDGGCRYEIYRIQLEYCIDFANDQKEAQLRPIWTFYYKRYYPKDAASWSYGVQYFYADTGDIRCVQ